VAFDVLAGLFGQDDTVSADAEGDALVIGGGAGSPGARRGGRRGVADLRRRT
jgi:hypothetical protein